MRTMPRSWTSSEKVHCPPGAPPGLPVYYQERCSKSASAAPFSSSCVKCKIPGWVLELIKSKVTQIRMTWKTFTAIWRRSTVPSVLALLHFWVQMDPSSYQRRTRSWIGGLSISMVFYTSHLLSTMRPLNNSRKSQWTNHSMSLQPWGQFRYLSVNYPVAPGSDSIPAEIYKEGGLVPTGKLLTLIQLIWMKERLRRTSRTPPSSIFINRKITDRHAIITLESLSFQFQARSEPESF